MKAELIKNLNKYFLRLHIALGIIYGSVHFLKGISYTPFLILISVLCSVVTLLNLNKISYQKVALFLSTNIFVALYCVISVTGGMDSPSMVWLFPTLVYSFISIEKKYTFPLFLLNVVSIGILAYFDYSEFLPPVITPLINPIYHESFNLIISIFVSYILLSKNQLLISLQANEVKKFNELNELIIQGAGTAVYDWTDMTLDEVYWSPKLYEILGYEDGEIPPSASLFSSLINKDDLKKNEVEMAEQLSKGNTFSSEFRLMKKSGEVRWVRSNGIVTKDESGNIKRMVGSVTDNHDFTKNRIQLEETTMKLDIINKSLQRFIDRKSVNKIFLEMLEAITYISKSKYCFIGEVLENSNLKYLRSFALTDISWDDESKKMFNDGMESGIEFHNLDSLFGEVIKSSGTIISNDTSTDPRAGKLPKGHPPLKNFLGIPIKYGDELVGVIGIANREDGYTNEEVKSLEPFTKTASIIINAHREIKKKSLYEQELKQKKFEAEIASKAKSTFLANMTHEIRTPLNGVIGLTEVLKPRLKEEDNIRILQDIERSGNHLLDVITDILDFSKIESEKVQIIKKEENLNEILDEMKSIYFELCNSKGIQFNLTKIGLEKPDFNIDKTRVKQVLNNLLSNALKFTHQGEISLSAEYKDGHLNFKVSDTGIGVEKEEYEYIFVAFHQSDLTLQKSYTGTGLGLAISKELAGLMEGDLTLESEINKGSTFHFSIKVDEPNTTPSTIVDLQTISIEDKFYKDITILIVEDNPLNMQVISSFLNYYKLNFKQATNGLEAVQITRDENIDFIFMDIQMPKLDGIAATKQIREFNKDVYIVALTANAFDEARDMALDCGMNYFQPKPVKKLDIVKCLSEYKKFKNQNEEKE